MERVVHYYGTGTWFYTLCSHSIYIIMKEKAHFILLSPGTQSLVPQPPPHIVRKTGYRLATLCRAAPCHPPPSPCVGSIPRRWRSRCPPWPPGKPNPAARLSERPLPR